MAKRQTKKRRQDRPTKAMRLAHKILTQTIWPADLKLDEVIDVVALVAKGIVLSSTPDDKPEERSDLIDVIGERVCQVLIEIDPLADRAHLWLVPPQGLITEPFGILWDGCYDDHSVQGVLGSELEELRTQYAATQAETGLIIRDGVAGVAMTVPDWDGEDTATCENPECGRVHDVHLTVAEELFQQTVAQRQRLSAAN